MGVFNRDEVIKATKKKRAHRIVRTEPEGRGDREKTKKDIHRVKHKDKF